MNTQITQSSPIATFQQLVELKDFKPPTRNEYVRYVRPLADHFQADPATLSEDQLRQYFRFLRQAKQFSGSAMSIGKAAFQLFFREGINRNVVFLTSRIRWLARTNVEKEFCGAPAAAERVGDCISRTVLDAASARRRAARAGPER